MKTWNLTLTPADGAIETYRGLSNDATADIVRALIDGVRPQDIDALRPRTGARANDTHDSALAA